MSLHSALHMAAGDPNSGSWAFRASVLSTEAVSPIPLPDFGYLSGISGAPDMVPVALLS